MTTGTLAHPPKQPPPPAAVQWVGVAPLSEASDWFSPALRKLTDMRRLGPDWDGYGSPPPCHAALDATRAVLGAVSSLLDLQAPELYPISGGGIGIRWRSGARELEFEVFPTGEVQFLKIQTSSTPPGESEESGFLPAAHPRGVQSLVGWMMALEQ